MEYGRQIIQYHIPITNFNYYILYILIVLIIHGKINYNIYNYC